MGQWLSTMRRATTSDQMVKTVTSFLSPDASRAHASHINTATGSEQILYLQPQCYEERILVPDTEDASSFFSEDLDWCNATQVFECRFDDVVTRAMRSWDGIANIRTQSMSDVSYAVCLSFFFQNNSQPPRVVWAGPDTALPLSIDMQNVTSVRCAVFTRDMIALGSMVMLRFVGILQPPSIITSPIHSWSTAEFYNLWREGEPHHRFEPTMAYDLCAFLEHAPRVEEAAAAAAAPDTPPPMVVDQEENAEEPAETIEQKDAEVFESEGVGLIVKTSDPVAMDRHHKAYRAKLADDQRLKDEERAAQRARNTTQHDRSSRVISLE